VSYVRIIGAVVAVALAAFIWWRVSLSFSQADELEVKAEQIAGLQAAAARDTRIATELSNFRAEQTAASQAFREELASKPITREVVRHVDTSTGEQIVCRERDPVRYRELFNSAIDGTSAGLR
jgi:hypothetical protein